MGRIWWNLCGAFIALSLLCSLSLVVSVAWESHKVDECLRINKDSARYACLKERL